MNPPPPLSPGLKAPRREIFAWAMYDWANSAYSTLSVTVLALYLTKVVLPADSPQAKSLSEAAKGLGLTIAPQDWGAAAWAWGIGLSMLLAAVLSPLTGAMADARNSKRWWLAGTALPGAACCVLFAAIPSGEVWLTLALFFAVSLLFELSFGFYNAFLPELAEDAMMDRVSAWGYSLGYVGGGIALGIGILLANFGPRFGFADLESQLKAGLVTMGLWWGLFTLPAAFWLRDRGPPPAVGQTLPSAARSAYRQVKDSIKHVRRYRTLALFLLGFLLFNDGIATVIAQASIFATDEVGFTFGELVAFYFVFQFTCLPGAMTVGYLTERFGQKRTLILSLAIWIVLLAAAYFVREKWQFWVLGALLALVMGGTQSVSRAIMGVMTPQRHTAEFFGFFNFSGKATSWMGSILVGVVAPLTGSFRLAIVSLIVLFALGLLVVVRIDVAQGKREALEPMS